MKRYLLYISAFIGSLIFPYLAFAQPSDSGANLLSPSPGDLSIQYLQDIFGIVDGVLHGAGSQIMGAMFTVFNAGALALGGIIIIYTMIVSTLNTAHEGEPLGKKWSSMWIPIKSALGIALLLPKATGYSAIQIFMMWVIVQGVGLADNIWNAALGYLANGGVLVQEQLAIGSDIMPVVGNVLQSETCMFALQAALNQARQNVMTSTPPPTTPPPIVPVFLNTVVPVPTNGTATNSPVTCVAPNPSGGGTITATNCVSFPGISSKLGYDSSFDALAGYCGTIGWKVLDVSNTTIPGVASDTILNTNQAQAVAVQQLILDLSGPAQTIVNTMLNFAAPTGTPIYNGCIGSQCPCTTGSNCGVSAALTTQLFGNSAEDYQGIMQPALRAMLLGGGTNPVTRAIFSQASNFGWINAGTYYQVLAQTNNNLQSATGTAPTSTSDLSGYIGSNGNNIPFPASFNMPQPYRTALSYLLTNSSSADPAGLQQYITNAKQAAYDMNAGQGGSGKASGWANTILNNLTGSGVVSGILNAIPIFGPLINILVSFLQLATAQVSNVNPLVVLSSMGYSMMLLVVQAWAIGTIAVGAATAALGLIPCMTVSNSLPAAMIYAVPFLWGLLGTIFLNGAVLAFYLPMIPFIIFFFGAIGWLIAVIEAMIAAPLIALGITHPEGHEVLGKADPAVLLLVNVFLRPSMMIIGFIGGIILSYVAVWILNQGFFEAFGFAFVSTNVFSPIFWLFAIPALIIMYTALVIAVLNQAFALTNVIPDRVMRWIGSQVEGVGEMAQKGLGETKSAVESGMGGIGKGIGKQAGERLQQAQQDRERQEKASMGGSSAVGSDAAGEGGSDSMNVVQPPREEPD